MKTLLISLISLIPISSFSQNEVYYDFSKEPSNTSFALAYSIQAQGQAKEFSQFKFLLGQDNVKLMENSIAITKIELTGFINNYAVGLNYGFSNNSNTDIDTLVLNFNRFELGFHLSYKILHSKVIIVLPKVAIDWDRSRLINSANQPKIPLEQYISDRSLDIRFNHITVSVGSSFEYLINKSVFGFGDHFSIGLYGGYIANLNQKPWIFSVNNRLLTDSKDKINPLEIGINFTFYSF